MKITVHLIPIPPPHTPESPDPTDSFEQPPPADHVFHYTTGLKLRQILLSGQIKPSTAGIEPHEKPVAWFSTSDRWEPTATKVPISGMPGQLITAQIQGGLARISVPASCVPYGFEDLTRIAGTSHETCRGLLLAGLELGSNPTTWRFTPEPVPVSCFRDVEFLDFQTGTWLTVDLAELATRN